MHTSEARILKGLLETLATSDDTAKRRESAERLGEWSSSNREIIHALLIAERSDKSPAVQFAAMQALLSPHHKQTILENPDLLNYARATAATTQSQIQSTDEKRIIAEFERKRKQSMLSKGDPLQRSLYFTERDIYNDFPVLIEAIMNYLDFKNWGFEVEISHSVPSSNISSELLFQSTFCKLKMWTFRDRPYEHPEIYFAYGRLHARNDKAVMMWNGRECHCWHNHLNLNIALGFLDGLSPQTLAKREFPYRPDVIKEFDNKAPTLNRHERFAKYHQTIWNHYGQRLFDLYDLRNPEFWNQYVDFYQEFRSHITRFEFVYKADIC